MALFNKYAVRLREVLLLERHPNVMVMYHGTSAPMAKRIAKKGLLARPRDRQYPANDLDNYHLASLNGAYFTDQFHIAVGYAYKASMAFEVPGWCGIVMAEVPLADAVPDEDVIMSAMAQAERQGGTAERIARNFHRNLVQDRPIPMRADLMQKVRDAHAALEQAEDDDELLRNVQRYRRALDQMTRAYAAMVYDTHPIYMSGNHTMRLPRGLPVQNIQSVIQFEIRFDDDPGDDYPPGYPTVADVHSLLGESFTMDRLQEAVDTLQQQDFF